MRAKIFRSIFLCFFTIPLAFSQAPLTQLTFGGTGTDSLHGVTVDASGNIYVTGTTYSADLPVKNAFQPVNRGTQVVYSTDAGVTWQPLQSPLNPGPNPYAGLQIAVDPGNASIVYASSQSALCKSQDAGQHFLCANLPFLLNGAYISSLVVDPRTSSILYLSVGQEGGIFKSVDGGQTWNSASLGLPDTGFAYSIAVDPFHSGVLFAWGGTGGFVTPDGAATWTSSSLPYPTGVSTGETLFGFFFDAVTPGVVYGPGFVGTAGSGGRFTLQKSVDNGQTWVLLNVPFSAFTFMGADPKNAGTLYAVGAATGSTGFASLWKSADSGVTWTASFVPAGLAGPLVFDPQNPQIVLGGFYGTTSSNRQATYRSADGGQTWSPVAPRVLQPAFSPSAPGVVYAVGNPTSDAFLAKFLPDGQTLVFATYFGGSGNDEGSAIALDPSGNIWIAGATSSGDVPVTPGAFQTTLNGASNGFAAKFSNDGQLIASTYLGGSAGDSITSLAIGPQGNAWVGGRWTSFDFPFTTGPAPIRPSPVSYVSEFDSSGGQLLVSMPLDGWLDLDGNGIAADSSGNVIVTGTTNDPNFPSTSQPFAVPVPPPSSIPRVFVLKLDSSGSPIYSTTFGGSFGPPTIRSGVFGGVGNLGNYGVAAAVDSAGNAYITGYTSAADFPTTPGAYQSSLASACPYPAYQVNTGLIGVLSYYYIDDNFVAKLSPDGETAVYSTLIGGQCYDHPISIAVDSTGRAIVTGETDSFDYPQAAPVEGAPAYGQYASFLSVLNPSGTALDFSTYLYAGATPFVVAAPDGSFAVSGSAGPGAQFPLISGAYTVPSSSPTHGYIAILSPPQPPAPVNLTQVRNAFSLQPGPVAPGEIVALSVPGFIPDQPVDVGINPSAPLTTNLSGVQVFFDGRPAYLMSVLPGRIVCITPAEIAGQAATAVQVAATFGGSAGASNVLKVGVAATAVGLLALDGSGTGAANARNSDGSLNGPGNPAAVGSQVTIFFTGGGVTNPPEADGVLPVNLAMTPVGQLSIFPYGGAIYALPGFVPGIFSYTFTVSGPSPSSVSMQVNYWQSQFLTISVQ